MKITAKTARPSIYLVESEADRLADMALGIKDRAPEVSALLLGEIDRAKIVPVKRLPPDVVTMNSEVEFLDDGSHVRRVVRLVYPKDADIAAGRISILTHAGAGLIGLRPGQSILWPDREGRTRLITIVAVRQTATECQNG